MFLDSWRHLKNEIALWAASNCRPAMWWRDDDATEGTPALTRLLEIAATRRVPLALAVVPAYAKPSLAGVLGAARARGANVLILQHGYRHTSTLRDKKMELDDSRPLDELRHELELGRAQLHNLFGAAALPVMVPPWNRISASLLPVLVELGFRGLSTEDSCSRSELKGLREANADIDIIRWKPRNTRGFRGESEILRQMVDLLAARREGRTEAREPIGFLTHHAVHDESCWQFVDKLFHELQIGGIVQLVDARTVFFS